MNIKKISLLLAIIIGVTLAVSACSLFGGDDDNVPAGELPALDDRFYFVPSEYFVTNISESQALTKVSVALALTSDKVMETLTANEAAIRNVIVKILRSHTEEELRSDNAIEVLEMEMTEQLKETLQMNEFVQLFISDYVIN